MTTQAVLYDMAKSNIFCVVERPNGYRGETALAGLAIVEGDLYEVYDFGCFRAPVPASTQCEAFRLIRNHVAFKNYRVISN